MYHTFYDNWTDTFTLKYKYDDTHCNNAVRSLLFVSFPVHNFLFHIIFRDVMVTVLDKKLKESFQFAHSFLQI